MLYTVYSGSADNILILLVTRRSRKDHDTTIPHELLLFCKLESMPYFFKYLFVNLQSEKWPLNKHLKQSVQTYCPHKQAIN